jgi:uncharacterized protein (DUF2236 family)
VRSANFLTEPLRRSLAGTVRRTFNDQSKGETPVIPSDHALIPRGSVAWRVHGDVTTMMVGGISGLLMQMLHPQALAGVWDHSNFREDMLGRLRRTARFIATTTYGERTDAERLIARVRSIHEQVRGKLPDGTPYRANDPALLAWIHVAGEISFLDSWIRFAEPDMSGADQDLFFADVAVIAEKLGADPIPRTRAEAKSLIARFRPQLIANERTRIVRDYILRPPGTTPATLPVQLLLGRAAVDLLPRWARSMHQLGGSKLGAPFVSAGVRGLGGSLRWALRRR